MATVSRESIGLLNDKIIVSVSKEDYYPEFEKGLKQYAKQANIPGFRKGMVPAGVLKKMYGQSLFVEQVVKLAEKELVNFLEADKSLRILGQPIPLETAQTPDIHYNNPIDYTFTFEIGLEPEIDTNLDKANLTRYKINVTDKMVDEDLEDLRKRYGKYSEPETITYDENYVSLDIELSDAEGNVAEGTEAKPVNILVNYFTTENQPKLIGKKVGDTLVIKLSDSFNEKEGAAVLNELGLDKDAVADNFYKATITRIGLQEPAELNDEFFKKVFPAVEIKSEEDLKATLKEEIVKSFYDQSKSQLQDQIYHHFVDHTEIPLPLDFLKRWLKLNEATASANDEEFETKFKSYAKDMKWTIVVGKLVEEHKVTVEQQDFRNHAKQQLLGYMQQYSLGEGANSEWIDSYAESMLKDKKFMEKSYYEIRMNKVFDAIDGIVKTKEEPIELEAFKEKLHHHHH